MEDRCVSESIIERYNKVQSKIYNRSDLKSVVDKLEKAMSDFVKVVADAEDALTEAEAFA